MKSMDYTKLAEEFLEKMHLLKRTKPQKRVDETMRGEMFALQYIYRHGADVLPSAISDEVDISTARIAATLNGLESKGLITRQIDTSDRRRILVNLTESGRELAESVGREMLSDMSKMFSILGEKDAKEYLRITGRILEIMQNFSDPNKTI